MKSSNICRDRWLIAAAIVCLAADCRAVDPNRTSSQYVRETWGTDRGFPRGPVYSINQTSDGYLWIGTEKGLVRFDGLNFRVMEAKITEADSLTHVLQLLPDRDGSLWIRLRRPGLLRSAGDVFQNPLELFDRPHASVAAMTRANDGGIVLWILEGEASAIELRGGKFVTLAAPVAFSRSPVLRLAQTQNGDLWVATRDAGLFRVRGNRAQPITDGLPDLKINALAHMGANELWVGTDNGIVRWDGARLTKAGVPRSLDGVQALAEAVDRDGNLWVGAARGLVRLNERGAAWMTADASHPAVTALFEDREGNLWTGSANGLERIRDSVFVSYSSAEGLPSDHPGAIYADREERVWFAPVEGGLWWMHEGQRERITAGGLGGDIVYSIAGGSDGVWIGRQRGGLTRLRIKQGAIESTTYSVRDGLAQNSVDSVYEARDGSVWAGTLSGGATRLDHGRFTTYTAANGLASNTVASIVGTAEGTMWFATPQGLSAFSSGQWRTLTKADGLPSDNVNCLLEDSHGALWIGTAGGLAFFVNGRVQAAAGAMLGEPVLGIAEDPGGALWIATSVHVLRVNREKVLSGASTDGDLREFTLADGLRGVEGVRRNRSVVTDANGRVWFALNRGLSVVDPARLTREFAPTMVQVESISADGAAIAIKDPVHIPGGRKRVTLSYAGLSLAAPERIRFRYMLDGFEGGWSAPTAQREAAFTNLAPGPYRFRITASDADGGWSGHETVVGFDVDPLFWQTRWFRLSVLAAVALAALGLYRLRLHQLTRQLNLRFEERLAERTRIAQELHDTLLQGFLSASMQVNVAVDQLPEESRVKPMLTRATELMKQVIDEGRNAVRGLRSSKSASLELEHALALVRDELGEGATGAGFRVIVDGQTRALHPLLRDELYRIGREALINAFRHSRAKQIEIELKYSPRHLRMFVRDDGAGIDPHILKTGRDGHFGLSGMRERADRIGARFHVFSSASAGTEIELSVPGHVAFQDQPRRKLWFPRKW
ncbi:MAG: hypothetical protein LAO79_23150 [Acidobacteriia bacterium]|nr:hypothetical protein [Terriglobia bacterium]